jgi:hypothetical protein
MGSLYSSQLDTAYPFNSQVADDFQFGSGQTITEIIFWGGFWNGDPINPIDLNVIFYADDGTGNMQLVLDQLTQHQQLFSLTSMQP